MIKIVVIIIVLAVAKILISRLIRNNKGGSNLHKAADQGDILEVTKLLSNTDIEIKDQNGRTPLHDAVKKNHLAVVDLLLNHGANVHSKDNSSVTPLHEVVTHSVAETLITAGADVNAVDADGFTPLHYAVGNLPDLIEILVKKGADINAKSNDGDTALSGYARIGSNVVDQLGKKNNEEYIEKAQQLIDFGANTEGIDLSWMKK